MQTRPCIAKTILGQNNKSADITITGSKTHYRTAVTKPASIITPTPRPREEGRNSRNKPMNLYSKFILNKGVKKTHTHPSCT